MLSQLLERLARASVKSPSDDHRGRSRRASLVGDLVRGRSGRQLSSSASLPRRLRLLLLRAELRAEGGISARATTHRSMSCEASSRSRAARRRACEARVRRPAPETARRGRQPRRRREAGAEGLAGGVATERRTGSARGPARLGDGSVLPAATDARRARRGLARGVAGSGRRARWLFGSACLALAAQQRPRDASAIMPRGIMRTSPRDSIPLRT